jgi:hypothetical protein
METPASMWEECSACHGTGRINVASSETRSTPMSHEPKNAPKELSELCPDCGHKLRERTHPLIHCAAPPGRCFCRGWILRKPPKELSERGLHTTETVADGSIANHEHVYRCQDCGEIGRGPADSPPPLQESARELRYKAQMLHSFEGGASHWGDELTLSMLAEYASEVACDLIAAETDRARAEGARAELEIIYEMINSRKMSAVKFRVKARLAALDKQEKTDEL